jgi:hypothetical protein
MAEMDDDVPDDFLVEPPNWQARPSDVRQSQASGPDEVDGVSPRSDEGA